MKTTAFLLAAAVALLLTLDLTTSARIARSNVNLNGIIDETMKFNESFYVEDVEHLANNGCKSDFFCKVHQILKGDKLSDHKIVRNLDGYIRHINVNCTEVLKGVKDTGVKKPLPALLHNLRECCRRKNLAS